MLNGVEVLSPSVTMSVRSNNNDDCSEQNASNTAVMAATEYLLIDELIGRYWEQSRRKRAMLCTSVEEIIADTFVRFQILLRMISLLPQLFVYRAHL